jgi:hypothetical protein
LITLAATIVILHADAVAETKVLGWDFRGSTWTAAHQILHGINPYPVGLIHANSFVYPPLLAELAIPLTVLPAAVALAVWDALSFAAFAVALRLVGVRDWRLMLIALGSLPMATCLILGQPTAFLALAAAAAWRWRYRPWVAGLAVGVSLAAKPLAWPLLVWLVACRLNRAALIAAGSSAFILVVSWAPLGFAGMSDFPGLMGRLSSQWQAQTHSIMSLTLQSGGSTWLGWTLTVIALVGILAGCLVLARRGETAAAFALAAAASAYSGPLVHHHYLLLLIVGLAAARPRPSLAWLLVPMLWLSSTEPELVTWRLAAFTGIAAGLIVVAFTSRGSAQGYARPPRAGTKHGAEPQRFFTWVGERQARIRSPLAPHQ